jgi:subtilisin family serine protease
MKTDTKLLIAALVALSVFLIGMTSNAQQKILRVAVIDTGFGFDAELNKKAFKICKTGSFDFTKNLPVVGDDNNGHGTAVMALINRHAKTKNMCFMIYKALGDDGYGDLDNINKALIAAYRYKADVINMSLGSTFHDAKQKRILKTLTRSGIKVFAAAGNSKKDLNTECNSYPTCYKYVSPNLIPVGATDEDSDVAKYSNRGAFISVYKYGRTFLGARGTSFAAPRAAGDYIQSLNWDNK